MPKKAKELSNLEVRRLKHAIASSGKPYNAVYAVGGVSGLYIQCVPPKGSNGAGAKSWILRALVGGKRRDIGLGGYPTVPIKDAREAAKTIKADIKAGIDPVIVAKSIKSKLKAEQAKEITFKEYAQKNFIPNRAKEYKSPQQVRRLNQLLRDYVFPHIGNLLITDIERAHVINLLKPIWETKNETAKRVQNYVQKVIQQAIADGLREKANPATWKDDLALSFPKASKIHKVRHHRFLDWRKLPDFMKSLHELETHKDSRPDVKCMAFMILTVARPSEARLVDWKEIDLDKRVWNVPAGKYKSNRDWKIPLTPQAIKILKSMPTRKGRVFSTIDGNEIHDKYLSAMPDALGFDAVAHGFRSTFRTWGQEQQRFTEEVLELSLKHIDTNATRAAYARSQLFDERKEVLTAYSKWAMKGDSGQSSKVVPLTKRQRES